MNFELQQQLNRQYSLLFNDMTIPLEATVTLEYVTNWAKEYNATIVEHDEKTSTLTALLKAQIPAIHSCGFIPFQSNKLFETYQLSVKRWIAKSILNTEQFNLYESNQHNGPERTKLVKRIYYIKEQIRSILFPIEEELESNANNQLMLIPPAEIVETPKEADEEEEEQHSPNGTHSAHTSHHSDSASASPAWSIPSTPTSLDEGERIQMNNPKDNRRLHYMDESKLPPDITWGVFDDGHCYVKFGLPLPGKVYTFGYLKNGFKVTQIKRSKRNNKHRRR